MSERLSADTDTDTDTDELVAQDIAGLIHQGYRAYRQGFQAVTVAASDRFRNADWLGIQEANAERLALYGIHVEQVVRRIQLLTGGSFRSALWPAIRAAYIGLIRNEYNAELFETFFNSLHRILSHDSNVSDREMFVTSAFPTPPIAPGESLIRSYRAERGVVDMMRRIARDLPLDLPWQDLDRDIGSLLRSLVEARPEIESVDGFEVDIIKPIFYRNKGAYVVGRIRYQQAEWPLALPLLLDEQRQLYIDTLICDEDELSVMFSFTRAYFMVHVYYPHALVDFLSGMLPNKKRSELYSSIGLHKHGKTVFYRALLEHLEQSSDPFVIAPGIKGMVMSVFMLPSYQTVFKIIKDRFPPQKQITREQVRERYYIVKKHDRVGRMADTLEFENLVLPRARFDPALLAELQAVAASSVEITDTTVRIRHLYTERQMTPLNLYIEDADPSALREVLDEYGNAIKQLSAANIFPGDMLLKNFGVTRHGRVVFYDYDEICYLTDVNFRAIPQPLTPEQELAAEAWYTVGPNDVFPEEFRRFLFGKPGIKRLFAEMHGELFDPGYWRDMQTAIRGGQVMDVFPYRRKKRFVRQGKPPPGGVPDELGEFTPAPDRPAVPSPAAAARSPADNPIRAASGTGLIAAATTPHRALGALTGLTRLAIDELRVAPGQQTPLPDGLVGAEQEGFLYVVAGAGTLLTPTGSISLSAGDMVGMAPVPAPALLTSTGSDPLVALIGVTRR